MISALSSSNSINILLVLILLTAAIITISRNILSMVFVYSIQSFLIVLVSIVLYISTQNHVLATIAALTLVSKVFLIPYATYKVQHRLKTKRAVEFHYLTPTTSIFLSILVLFIVYNTFSNISASLGSKTFLIAIALSISLVFMGMIIMFTRKQTLTNVIGYLTMENGVLLFGLFVAELPLIIEVLILVDSLMLIIIATLLAFGIDSTIEEYHARLHLFNGFKVKR